MKKFKKQILGEITYPRLRSNSNASNSSNPESYIAQLYAETSGLDNTIELSNPNIILEMAEALRSTVNLLKTFDGTPSRLESFINQIDTFHTRYFNTDPSQQEYVVLAIKSKILGSAEDFLLTRPDLKTWDDIKSALQQKFNDPITRANLQQQLIFLTRKNEPVQDYIQNLKALVTKINTKICTEIQNAEARTVLITQNELTATQNLLANIPNELRTLLIVQNPTTLDNAIEIITNYEILTSQNNFKQNYIQNHTKSNSRPSLFSTPQRPPIYTSNNNTQNFQNFPKLRNSHPTNRPSSSQNYQSMNQQRRFTPHTRFPHSSPNKQYPNNMPQPMSGVSTAVPQTHKSFNQPKYQQRPFQQQFRLPFPQTPQQKYTFQELTHIEDPDYDETCSTNDYSEENYYLDDLNPDETSPSEDITDQLENFQSPASNETNPA